MNITPISSSQFIPKDYFEETPKDILKIIFRSLNFNSIRCMSLTNFRFHQLIAEDGELWRHLVEKFFPIHTHQNTQNAKEICKQRLFVNNNIKMGRYRLKTLTSFQEPISTMLMHKNKLISGSMHGTIKIWDIETGKELNSFIDARGGVSCLKVIYGTHLISSHGKFIHIWDIENGEFYYTYDGYFIDAEGNQVKEGHFRPVNSFIIHRQNLISGSDDLTVKIWNFQTGRVEATLKAQERVFSVEAYENNLFVGLFNGDIQVWNIKEKKILRTVVGHTSHVKLQIDAGKLISASSFVNIFDIEKEIMSNSIFMNGEVLKKIAPQRLKKGENLYEFTDIHNFRIYENKIVTREKRTITLWDGAQKEPISFLFRGPYTSCFEIYGDKWIFNSRRIDDSEDPHIEVLNFNYSHLSAYDAQTLTESLTILNQIIVAKQLNDIEKEKRLVDILHTDFKQRLERYSFKTDISTYSQAIVLHLQTEVCIELLFHALYIDDTERVSELLLQLVQIDPQNTQLYGLLSEVCKKSNTDSWGEHAFFNQTGYEVPFFKKEEAVIKFKQKLKKKPLLLADLGILTEEQYSNKINRTGEFLAEIGLKSSEDLEALGLYFATFQKLPLNIEKFDDRIALQSQAFRNNQLIFSTLHTLFSMIEERFKESNQDHFYEGDKNPWTDLKKDLNTFINEFQKLATQCQNRNILLEKFNSENYKEIAEKVNSMIEKFEEIDKEHQIKKVRAYANQWGIHKVWLRLHQAGIESLAALLKQLNPPNNLFAMGE